MNQTTFSLLFSFAHFKIIANLYSKKKLELYDKFVRCFSLRPAETEASPYAGYQLAYEVKKLMYDKPFSNLPFAVGFLIITCCVVLFSLSIFVYPTKSLFLSLFVSIHYFRKPD
jgi:hypothetical protein